MIKRIALTAAVSLLAFSAASAQKNSSPKSTAGGAIGTSKAPDNVQVLIAPEQRTIIKEYVVRERVPRATVTERVRVGTTLPSSVELHEVPSGWGPAVTRYRYVYTDSGIHFVDPASRRVIYDID